MYHCMAMQVTNFLMENQVAILCQYLLPQESIKMLYKHQSRFWSYLHHYSSNQNWMWRRAHERERGK